MAENDFDIRAIISAETSKFDKQIKGAEKSMQSFSASIEGVSKLLKSAFSVVGITASVGAIVNFGKKAVQSADEANKRFNVLANTIKATGASTWTSVEELDNMAKAYAKTTNYSVSEIEKMQSVLLGFRNITGETFGEASDAIMDMATVMGMDLTSAVQTVGKALDDPIKGLDSLRRQGFQFTEEQKAELTQLVKNGKQLEAQQIILKELGNTYGGAAKAGQSAFAQLQHSMDEFRENIGNKLMPVVNNVMSNMTKAMEKITTVIDSEAFNNFIAILINLANKVKQILSEIKNYFSEVFTEIQEIAKQVNFSPFIKVIDTLIGVISESFDRIKVIIKSAIESFSNIGSNIGSFIDTKDLEKVVNVINTAIDIFWFLYEEVQKVQEQIRTLIVNTIINVWNKIKEIFNKSNDALATSEGNIKSWGDFFYNQFNTIFRTVQDLIYGVKALLSGDWQTAWEYAKLVVLRMADRVLDAISTMLNAFPNLINKMVDELNDWLKKVNAVREFFHREPLDPFARFEGVNLSEKTGIEKYITETEKKIQELTGHVADKAIKDLEGISQRSSGALGKIVDEITDTSGVIMDNSDQRKKYELENIGEVEEAFSSTYKKLSDWDIKLLNQRLEGLKDYSKEYHDIQLELIEAEREKAHQADTTGADTLKINQYYDKEIEKENERSEKAKRNHVKETIAKIAGYMKTFAKNTVEVFKKVVSTIKSVFSTIGNFIKNTFDKVKNLFSTLFEFNIDDALNNLLKIEDAILTFFVETLPNLPSFFESAFSSVLVLVQTLMNSINWKEVKGFLDSMVKTFVTYAPEIIAGITDIFTKLFSTVSEVLVENAPEITKAFGDMFFGIIEALPEIIKNVIDVLGTYISNIGKYFADHAKQLSDDLTNIVKSIVDGLVKFIKEGGWRNILQGLLAIQKAIENAIADNMEEIAQMIEDMLPDLVQTLIDSIVSASKTLGKIAKTLLPLIAKIITAIIEVITSDEVIDASIEAIEGLIEGLIPAIVELLVNALPKIINFFLIKLPSYTPKLVTGIIKGLIKGFTKVNWGQVVVDIFTGFIDAIMDLFGIHSPSTLFEGFGTNMVEGLINGLKGITDAVSGIFEGLLNFITGIFSSISDNVTSIFNNLSTNTTSIFNNISSSATSIFNGLLGSLTSITNGIFSSITSVFNSITSSITSVLTSLISQVNSLISQISSISVPGLPGSGGGGGGFDPLDLIDPLGIRHWFADGTNDAPKGLSVVGEAGPELVNFKGGEQVLNSSNTQKALEGMGSKTINQSITFNNLQDTTAFAMMQQMKQYNRVLAINGII